VNIGNLAPGACADYSTNYTPNNIDAVINGVGGPGTGAGRYFFDDLIKITAATPAFGSIPTLTTPAACSGTFGCASASCPVCQGTGECTAQ